MNEFHEEGFQKAQEALNRVFKIEEKEKRLDCLKYFYYSAVHDMNYCLVILLQIVLDVDKLEELAPDIRRIFEIKHSDALQNFCDEFVDLYKIQDSEYRIFEKILKREIYVEVFNTILQFALDIFIRIHRKEF